MSNRLKRYMEPLTSSTSMENKVKFIIRHRSVFDSLKLSRHARPNNFLRLMPHSLLGGVAVHEKILSLFEGLTRRTHIEIQKGNTDFHTINAGWMRNLSKPQPTFMFVMLPLLSDLVYETYLLTINLSSKLERVSRCYFSILLCTWLFGEGHQFWLESVWMRPLPNSTE